MESANMSGGVPGQNIPFQPSRSTIPSADPEESTALPPHSVNQYTQNGKHLAPRISPPAKATARLRSCWKQCANVLKQFWNKSWTVEICSCIFALLALIGLILTLMAHENRPLPNWPNLVNINSIISLFSLLMRASTGMVLAEGISQLKWQWFQDLRNLNDMELFDSASRSAWGSFVMVLNLGRRRPYLVAAFGALTTVMASFCGFALQQLILFPECLRQDESAMVGISKTNYYFASDEMTNAFSADVYLPMVAAVTVGMFQPVDDLTNTLSHGCHTGNCTFPAVNGSTFSTVGISHSCEDITAQAVLVPNEETKGSDRFNVSIPLDPTRNLTLLLDSTVDMVTGVSSDSSLGMISTIKILKQTRPTNLTDYIALSCSLWPSVNTYGVNITNSIISEKLIERIPIGLNYLALETSSQGGTTPEFNVLYKLAMDYTLRNGSKTLCDRQRKLPNDDYIRVDEGNMNNSPTPEEFQWERENFTIWYYPQDCIWRFGRASSTGIDRYMKEIFEEGEFDWMGKIVGNQGNSHLQQVFQEGNMTLQTVDSLFKNISTAMTTVVRTLGPEDASSNANGTVWYTTTCMAISWPWISYPATMIGLSILFLILVHIETKGVEHSRLWKSSVLATLFCELDDKIRDKATSVDREVIEEIAKSTSVSLKQETGALKLVTR